MADAKGYLASEPVVAFLPEGEDRAIELRLRRGGIVLVDVRDRAGRPVEGIGVERRDPAGAGRDDGGDGEEHSVRTDAEGRARFEALEPGAYAFRAVDRTRPEGMFFGRGGGGGGADGEGWVEVVATSGATATLEFTVEGRGGLSGTVREGGMPLAGARLRLIDPEQPERARQYYWGGEGDPMTTISDGRGTTASRGSAAARTPSRSPTARGRWSRGSTSRSRTRPGPSTSTSTSRRSRAASSARTATPSRASTCSA
jgi:hypothetical protein